MTFDDLTDRLRNIHSLYAKRGKLTDREAAEQYGQHVSHIQSDITFLVRGGFLQEIEPVWDEERGVTIRCCRVRMRTLVSEGTKMDRYRSITTQWSTCSRCLLCDYRRRVVFGRGNLNAPVFVIGSGPGASEDVSGVPFVGSAGRQLNEMLDLSGLKHGGSGEVFIANLTGCRNSDVIVDEEITIPPDRDMTTECMPRLEAILDIVSPRIVVLVGPHVAPHLFAKKPKSFPLSWRGVSFYQVSDLPLHDDTTPTDVRVKAVANSRIEWKKVAESVKRMSPESYTVSPDIVWKLPLVISGDKA